MANTSSAKKAARQAAKRTEINKARKSRVRGCVRKVEQAIASGDRAAAEAAFREAQPIIMSGTHKNVLHRNTAARKISRLAHRIKSIQAPA
jgi:small subunit ribosomal protein S20